MKTKLIDNDEKAVSLLCEGLRYAKKFDLHWSQRFYTSFDQTDDHPCGTFCCVLGHLGNKYGFFIRCADDLDKICTTTPEPREKLMFCFLMTSPQDFIDEVERSFGKPAARRVVRAAKDIKIFEESESGEI